MEYRKEIDGLRALAVLPVILCHAGFEIFSGGFVGVDIFFVISGYLITSIILGELEQGKFSILNFYERRARRILPALFFVLLICLPFAWLWLLPSEMKDFSQSLVAVSFFSSNLLFWRESGYFDAAAELKPLLHTWSLAVEEQFYLLFPFFLMVFWKTGKKWVILILGILFAASLAGAQWAALNNPDAAFYLLPTRGWELLLGAFVAFYLARPDRKVFGRSLSELAGWLGIGLIFYAVFSYNPSTIFPGFSALIPATGTALIILFANRDTLAGRFVGNKAFVSVGLVSYSAYLWHQPLLVFARHRDLSELPELDASLALFLSAMSLVLAYVSWKYIESPFRDRKKTSRRVIFSSAILLSCTFTGIGLWGHLSDGFADHRGSELQAIYAIPDVESSFCHTRGLRTIEQLQDGDFCKIGAGPTSLAVVGDSHAGALFTAMDGLLTRNSISALAVSNGYCAPLLNGFQAANHCPKVTEVALTQIAMKPEIDTVILVAEWAIYTKGFRDNQEPQSWKDDQGKASSPSGNPAVFRRSLLKTLDFLEDAGKKVVVIYPVPEFQRRAYDFMGKQVLINGLSANAAAKALPTISRAAYHERNEEVFAVFSEIENRVELIEVGSLFCRAETCYQAPDGLPLYSDTNHINSLGAEQLVSRLFERIESSNR